MRTSHNAIAETQRLRAELAELRGLVADHFSAQSSEPQVDISTARRWAAEAAERAYSDHERGLDIGNDVALGADQEHRAFVHAVRQGFGEGVEAKHSMLAEQDAIRQQQRWEQRQTEMAPEL